MKHITEMPEGLRYFKINGQRILDIRSTAIEAIPARLKGVDCVMTRSAQLKYIAPGYKGTVMAENWRKKVSTETSSQSIFDKMSDKDILLLKARFDDRNRLLLGIFNQSFRVSSAGNESKEIYLPSDLKFSWNSEHNMFQLDASATWLTKEPKIDGVGIVIMPSAQRLRELHTSEQNAQKIITKRNRRRDYGYIRHMTGEWVR